MSTKEKIDRLNRLLERQKDQRLLNMMIAMVEAYEKEEINGLAEISEEEKAAIDEGLAQADSGELISHDQVRKEIKEKFGF